MAIMKTEPPMSGLSPQQRAEADRLFSQAIQCARGGNYTEAAKYYKQALQYGHPKAQNNLGNLYKVGRGVARDVQEAFRLYMASAQQGNTTAMRNVALCYQDGIGTAADFDQAVAWLMTAAEQKDHYACAALASAYTKWNHKDDEKCLYWHKKAAEYGNADSMFALGAFYAQKGDHLDPDQAVRYYDSAARVGTPAMKLKVAQALDYSRNTSDNQALDLEKAKGWYIEVINCGEEKEQLAAAEGLDALYSYSETLIRDPLDMMKAYMTYRTLAMRGNRRACSLSAYCNEMGRGTVPNLDIAIMFYEKAREFEKVEWCQKKKTGNLLDSLYESHREYQMPPVKRNLHSHGKELYSQDVDSQKCIFNEQVYYVNTHYFDTSYLCVSNLNGTDIKILLELDNSWYTTNIHVNSTGIYLYEVQSHGKSWLRVLHIDFDGNQISEFKEECQADFEDGHLIKNVYFYDGCVYYSYEYDECEKHRVQIKRMDVDRRRVDVLYTKAVSIERIFATEKSLIFLAEYENDTCEMERMKGWMCLDLGTGVVECLSNPYCSPENVVDHPDIYDEESPNYNEQCSFDRNIVFFDLDRGIFWTERRAWEGTDSAHLSRIYYWEPKSLWGDRDQVLPQLPIWKITNTSHIGREYFDGTHYYYASCYYDFESSNCDGETFCWTKGNGGHGNCTEFIVAGDYLFLDIAAYYEEQYPLSTQKAAAIRKTWFEEELPGTLIEAYHNKSLFRTEEKQRPVLVSPDPVASHAASAAVEAKEKTLPAQSTGDLFVEKKIGETDVKYNICTFGSKFHIGFGVPVVVRINGRSYECKMHKMTKGRIDGMKKLYTENQIVLGDILRASYSQKDNVILLEKDK